MNLNMLDSLTKTSSPGKDKPQKKQSALIEQFKEQVAKNNTVKSVENNGEFSMLVSQPKLCIFAFFATWSPPCEQI